MNDNSYRSASTRLYGLALGCYAVSFVLPAYEIGNGHEAHPGAEAFLICLINVWGLGGMLPFAVWLANPAFWAAAAFWWVGNRYAAIAAALAAAQLGALMLFRPLLLVGYYVWLGCLVLLLAACITWAVPRSADPQADGMPKL